MQSYAESTVDLISALELEKPDVLGWSMVKTHPQLGEVPSGPLPLLHFFAFSEFMWHFSIL